VRRIEALTVVERVVVGRVVVRVVVVRRDGVLTVVRPVLACALRRLWVWVRQVWVWAWT